jgi:hypothetical protein
MIPFGETKILTALPGLVETFLQGLIREYLSQQTMEPIGILQGLVGVLDRELIA